MLATLVFVDVVPGMEDAFAEITAYNHENSRKEPGNVRFDVLRDNKNPSQFVAPMMNTPRRSIPTTPLCFD